MICAAVLPAIGRAAPIAIVNSGFEDTSGQTTFNEFTFGTPTGWTQHDPNGIIVGAGNGQDVFLGTLQPNGTDFFNTTAPEGNKVAILFNRDGSTRLPFQRPVRWHYSVWLLVVSRSDSGGGSRRLSLNNP